MPKDEQETLISVYYPWLPSRCLTCQTWGHKETECQKMKMGSVVILEKEKENKNVEDIHRSGEVEVNKEKEATEDDTKILKEDTEEKWITVQRSGQSSPQKSEKTKEVLNQLMNTIDGNAVSPSRFNILSQVDEDEDDEKEDGEITVDLPNDIQQEDDSSSSEEEIPIKQSNSAKQTNQQAEEKKKKKQAPRNQQHNRQEQKLSQQNKANKKSSSRRN
ncbi:unnamed protein product [Arabis nemorensis]|uniref:DUF4283 domain-containing protein n=1 Tax=Arabis nemorensis TaxID=586526 RepID=A0A565CTT8_9BRAS|nr:unnamed protein product [Arabis nemorensis]